MTRRVLLRGAAALTTVPVAGAALAGCSPGSRSRIGLNVAGAEFDVGGPFDSDASFAFYAERGFEVVRLPFLWESVQPVLGEPLDQAYLEQLRAAVRACTSRDVTCVLDVHNYGRYDGEPLGGDGVPATALADLWGRLAAAFADEEELVELGLMNEPHDLPGGAEAWQRAAQGAVDAIRDAGARNWVWVPGERWSSAASWADTHPEWWVRDRLGRSGPEGHYYFDADNEHRGTYPGTYADDDARARRDGHGDLPTKVADALDSFLRYCDEQGVRGFLGEIGWPSDEASASHPEDAERWNDLGRAAYAQLLDGGVDVAAWAAGERWGDEYPLSVYLGTPQQDATSVAGVVEPDQVQA